MLAIRKVRAVRVRSEARADRPAVGVDEAHQHQRVERDDLLVDEFLSRVGVGDLANSCATSCITELSRRIVRVACSANTAADVYSSRKLSAIASDRALPIRIATAIHTATTSARPKAAIHRVSREVLSGDSKANDARLSAASPVLKLRARFYAQAPLSGKPINAAHFAPIRAHSAGAGGAHGERHRALGAGEIARGARIRSAARLRPASAALIANAVPEGCAETRPSLRNAVSAPRAGQHDFGGLARSAEHDDLERMRASGLENDCSAYKPALVIGRRSTNVHPRPRERPHKPARPGGPPPRGKARSAGACRRRRAASQTEGAG